MMNNNNHQNSNCSFAPEIVSYIYDEIGVKEKFAFEAHLANCATCPEELADFMEIRFSVTDWKQNEFAPLATPVIEIPFEKEQVREIAAVQSSWLSNLRAIFTLSPSFATASAAMAALVICAGLVFVVIKYSGNVEVAAVENTNKTKPSVSPTMEVLPNKSAEKIIADNEKTTDKVIVNPPKAQNNETTVVKFVERKPKNVAQNSENRPINTMVNKFNRPNVRKNSPANNRQLPRLNNFDEDEDDSLRLAELFEDIETLE